MHKIDLIVGDHSGDGHEKTFIYRISSNLDSFQLEQAYLEGTAILGFSLKQKFKGYSDEKFTEEDIKLLRKANYDNPNFYEEVAGGFLYLGTEEYIELYLFVCKLGNSGFSWEEEKADSTLAIGGYGLFV